MFCNTINLWKIQQARRCEWPITIVWPLVLRRICWREPTNFLDLPAIRCLTQSLDFSDELNDVGREIIRRLERREVPATRHVRPVNHFVRTFDPRARRKGCLVRKSGNAAANTHTLAALEAQRCASRFEVEAHRRRDGVGRPRKRSKRRRRANHNKADNAYMFVGVISPRDGGHYTTAFRAMTSR